MVDFKFYDTVFDNNHKEKINQDLKNLAKP